MSSATAVPKEPRSIFLRGYVKREKPPKKGAFKVVQDFESDEVDRVPPSHWTLTFDCETTTDQFQTLRFGSYQLRKNGKLTKRGLGLFYPETISEADLAVLKGVADETGARLLTVGQFVDWVFYEKVFRFGGTIVGFNLPFDISRIAVKHGKARKTMRGGFSFQLSANPRWPRVRVLHKSSKVAFISFSAQSRNRTPESHKKHGLEVPPRRGSFVDVNTMASALLSGSHSLLTLSRDTLKVEHPKFETEEHGGPLTPDYVRYGMRDVQATWECYEKLTAQLASYQLNTIEPRTLYTEASLGKAYLKQMGVKPWREVQPDFPPEMIGQILSSYFGGRAEVHIRREKREVLYCDFLSMYPTVCTLMGLWRFVIAEGVDWEDATGEVQQWLNGLELDELLKRPTWRALTTLVQIKPDADMLPVRARYGGEPASNIGVNYLTSEEPLWFTLADVAASKVLSAEDGGPPKTPAILKAIRFTPRAVQADLKPIAIAGKPEFAVDPTNVDEDFYRRVIDLRQDVKSKGTGRSKEEKAARDQEQLALKILANATSYGIFIEMLVKDLIKPETLRGYGPDGAMFPVTTEVYEDPGYYFHPLLATLITGAARLMLALAERKAKDEGLDWVFCDTDSIAMAKPPKMSRPEFVRRAEAVCKQFRDLNPYEKQGGSILKIEEHNYRRGDEAKAELECSNPLYCYAVSAKRYVLFNELKPSGKILIRKASAHGLGHLLAPYSDPKAKRRLRRIKSLGVDLWQHDLWLRIVKSAEAGAATNFGVTTDLENDDRLSAPAASRYSATKPPLLDWFAPYNRRREYQASVRPFGFLLTFSCQKLDELAANDSIAAEWRRKTKTEPAPVSPFDRDPAKAAENAFDRHQKGKAVPSEWLKTYVDQLAQYHLQPEPKFFGGEVTRARGSLRRRHVVFDGLQLIGKESDHWQEQELIGESDAEIRYGLSDAERARCARQVRQAREKISSRKLARLAHCNERTLAVAAAADDPELNRIDDNRLKAIAEACQTALTAFADLAEADQALLEWAFEQRAVEGPIAFSRRVRIDPSNLAKVLLNKGRGLSDDMRHKLQSARAEDQAQNEASLSAT